MADEADAGDAELNTAGDAVPTDRHETAEDDESGGPPTAVPSQSPVRLALIAGVAIVSALSALVGWLSYRTYESHQADQQRRLFLEAGRQGALNLTTIDYSHVEADVARVLDSSTGTFYDDFHQRSQAFIDVVKQVQSKSVGTIAEAGLESVHADEARVLAAVQVKTATPGAADPQLRGWRMRIDVRKVGGEVKMSNVEFVP